MRNIGIITWEACLQCRHADEEGFCTLGLSDKEIREMITCNTLFTSIYCERFELR